MSGGGKSQGFPFFPFFEPMGGFKAMAGLEMQQKQIKELVRQVVTGHQIGLWVHGRGGTGKTHSIVEAILEAKPDWKPEKLVHQTPKGLFGMLASNPEGILFLDDCTQLFRNEGVFSILRNAFEVNSKDTKPFPNRTIKWSNSTQGDWVTDFRGSIIISSNEIPKQYSEAMTAFQTRVITFAYNPSSDEILEMMKAIASKGYARQTIGSLTPQEAMEVIDFIAEEYQAQNKPLDMRLLTKCFNSRLYSKQKRDTNWQGPLKVIVTGALSKNEMNDGDLLAIIKDIRAKKLNSAEQLKEFKKLTGYGRDKFYKLLKS